MQEDGDMWVLVMFLVVGALFFGAGGAEEVGVGKARSFRSQNLIVVAMAGHSWNQRSSRRRRCCGRGLSRSQRVPGVFVVFVVGRTTPEANFDLCNNHRNPKTYSSSAAAFLLLQPTHTSLFPPPAALELPVPTFSCSGYFSKANLAACVVFAY